MVGVGAMQSILLVETDRKTIGIDIGRKIIVADLRRVPPVNACCESVLKREKSIRMTENGDRYSETTACKAATLLLLMGYLCPNKTSCFANHRSSIIARARIICLW